MEYAGLVAGLGNPGKQYAGTRHNCGFMFIDLLLDKAGREGSVTELNGKKFNALLWRVTHPALDGVWLAAEPQTFMNDSGNAIQPIMAWHKLEPRNLLVVQDELDIPPGELRFKFGGGLAGHRGLTSISNCLGTRDYYRLRIGIGKPQFRDDVINWVLGRPLGADAEKMAQILPEALETFFVFSQKGLKAASQFARDASLAD